MMKRDDPDNSEPLVAAANMDVDADIAEGADATRGESECRQDAPAGENAGFAEDDESAAENGANEDSAESKDVGDGAIESEGRRRRLPRAAGIIIALVALAVISGGALLFAFNTGLDSSVPPASQPGGTEPGGVTTIPGGDVPKTSGNEDPVVKGDAGDAGTDNAGEGSTGPDGGTAADPPAVPDGPDGSDEGNVTPGLPGGTGSGGGGATGGGSGSGRVWHEGWNEWVVDTPGHYEQQLIQIAWDENIGHYGSICWDCGEEVTGNLLAHAEETGHMSGAYFGWILDSVIHHEAIYENVWVPEQGHNVWHEGYWE
jgi:hypothetical protein